MRSKQPFPPYSTPQELTKGKRTLALTLVIAVGAALLGIVAQRAVGDDRLVTAYTAAAIIWALAAVGEAVRWSRTGELELEPAD